MNKIKRIANYPFFKKKKLSYNQFSCFVNA